MSMSAGNLCMFCSHYRGLSGDVTCDAFPESIPDAIWHNRADHRQPFAGDQGIRFEPKDPAVGLPDDIAQAVTRKPWEA